ncbi:MAG TPA: glycoside hydrolase, partial [Dehalococcoidia bacterium]
MKQLNVILAFHAQEPSWDLPKRVLETLRDDEMRRAAVGNDNWVKKRAESGRDIYRDLIDLGERLGAPVCLEATNEILMQVRRYMPATFERLGEAYRRSAIYPIYGNAFHTHIAMLTDEELADELRLNREFLRDVLRAPEPRHRGAFPMEGSIDAHKLAGFKRAGMEYVVFPNLSERKAHYEFDGLPEGADPVYGAFTIDDGLIALPRHFPISQEIWRPITKWQPDRLKPQGYILGKYHVLDEEYRDNKTVAFPIAREQAVAEYTQTLCDAVEAAPDGALLLYIQDLELMDFGEEALDILGEAWSTVRAEGKTNINFVTPDEYIDAIAGRQLPHMRFHQVSWAPEIRLVLRSDGHYPPLHAGPHEGIDNDVEVFRRWPFIFWEPGRFIADTFRSLVRSFGHPIEIGLTGAELDERGYALSDDLSDDQRIAIHLRAMQRACNYGWQPDEDRNKWPYMHGVAIAEILREEL